MAVEPDGLKPTENDRRIVALMVTCPVCGVTWDNDADPAGCTDPDHAHRIDWKDFPE